MKLALSLTPNKANHATSVSTWNYGCVRYWFLLQGGPKKVSHLPNDQKIVLNRIKTYE